MVIYIQIPDPEEERRKLFDLLNKYGVHAKESGFLVDQVVPSWIKIQGMTYTSITDLEIPKDSENIITQEILEDDGLEWIEECLKVFKQSYSELKDMLMGSFYLSISLQPKDRVNHILDVKLMGYDGECILRQRSIMTENGLGQKSIKGK